jgi:hypothetical protein
MSRPRRLGGTLLVAALASLPPAASAFAGISALGAD